MATETTAHLPTPQVDSKDVHGNAALLSQENNRVGMLMIRFSALVDHPLQRAVNQAWVHNLADKYFEGGENIQKSAHPIMVMAVDEGDVEVIEVPDLLPKANPSAKFYVLSGQHRVAAMKHIIKEKIIENQGHSVVNEDNILNDEDAEWPAIVYKKGPCAIVCRYIMLLLGINHCCMS